MFLGRRRSRHPGIRLLSRSRDIACFCWFFGTATPPLPAPCTAPPPLPCRTSCGGTQGASPAGPLHPTPSASCSELLRSKAELWGWAGWGALLARRGPRLSGSSLVRLLVSAASRGPSGAWAHGYLGWKILQSARL